MASGAADRLDVTTWIPSAGRSSATRSGWDAAGVAARSGDSAQDRFRAALNAARAEDDAAAARARAADQRDETAAARARQVAQRDQADATRAASERARDVSRQAEARTDNRRSGIARQTGAPAPGRQHTAPAADTTAAPSAHPEAGKTAPRSAASAQTETGKADHAGDRITDAGSAQDSAPGTTAATSNDPAQTEAAVPPQQAEAATQPASPDPAGALLSLLAALSEGGPGLVADAATDKPARGQEDATAASPAGSDTAVAAAAPGTVMRGLTGTASTGNSAAVGAAPVSGLTGARVGAIPLAAAKAPDKAGKNDTVAEAVPADTGDPAAAAAAGGASKDFLAALADAGQANGQGTSGSLLQGTAAPLQGGLSPSASSALITPGTAQTHAAAAPAQTAAPVQSDPAVPIGQVPMAIGLRSLNGSNEFQIRLDPAELGRIDVKLEIDKARGTVMTHLVVDRPETLAMLQRDANQLQQALSQAGLDPSGGGLNLSLRSDGSAQGGGGGQQGNAPRNGAVSWSRDPAEAAQDIPPAARLLRGYGGLDIRI